MRKLILFFLFIVIPYISPAQSWQELMDSCNAYQQARDYQSALKWALQAEVKAKAEFGEMDTNYVATIGAISEIWYYLGNLDSAIYYGAIYLSFCRNIFKKDHPNIVLNINNLAYCYKLIGDFSKAELLYIEALEIYRRILKTDHPELAVSINEMADFYDDWGDYSKAELLYIEALEMNRRIFQTDHPNLATSIGNMAYIYNARGDFIKAEPLYIEALEMRRRIFKTDHPELAVSINEMALFYHARGDFIKVEPLYIEALEMRRRIFKTDHTDIAGSINNMASFYNTRGDYSKAEPLYIEALEMFRRIFKTDHPNLATSIGNMAYFYHARGDFIKAEPLYIEALEMRRRIFKTDHPELAMSINEMASFYNAKGDFSKAEPLYIKALEMRRRIFKTDHPHLALSINSLANFYEGRCDFSKAEPLYIEALEMRRRIYKTDHPDLANSVDNMAGFYDGRGDYSKAELLYIEALEMNRRIFKTDHPNLATSINNMAFFYHAKGDYSKAEPLYIKALEMFRRIFKTDHPELARGINNMAGFYYTRGDYSKAETLYIEALEMFMRIFKTDHPNLAASISNMATFYNARGDYSKAEPLFIESLKMYRRLYKTDHLELANSINNMASFYGGMWNYEDAEPLLKEALDMYKNIYYKQSINLSDKEKVLFWDTMKDYYEIFLSFVLKRMKENTGILGYVYDHILFSKSLQYNTASRIKKRILESGDSELISKFNELTSYKERLIKLYSLPTKEVEKQGYNIDSLENIANNLEKELSLKSEDYKQSYEKKKISWKSSIQPFLKPDEAAVEVVRFRLYDKNRWTDTVYYAFLIVNDETAEHPDIVILENGNELEGDAFNLYRKFISKKIPDNASFNKYWAKVYEKLKNYKKIYLSADGIYNKINISTLMMPDGSYLFDVQEIQLLNSTKDIQMGFFKKQDESSVYNSAVLIGNPNFSLSDQLVKEASQKIKKEEDVNYYNENLAASRGITLTSLPGTEKEIKDIEKFLKGKKWDVKSYLGDMALKAAVKAAYYPRVLHIATHGMFLEDVKSDNKLAFGFEEKKLVENPLLRSGLFFTGADNYLKPDSTRPYGENDALLTAYEAMNLDLDKTELVVLSACETGLGDIQNGEGVFGLRRAFQQAGAKTIIMSLWSVNDKTTQELMSTFYKEWLGGKTKREAFKTAQMKLKEKYTYPYYWGAFVMVGE